MGRIGLATLTPVEVASLLGNWWDEINDSIRWQDGIFYTLCAAYALVSSIALVPPSPFPRSASLSLMCLIWHLRR